MAEIMCCGCGNIFDSQAVACPRCQRCPRCGTKILEVAQACPTCGHSTNASALAELEKELDPKLPSNQKAIHKLERGWEIEQLQKRLRPWMLLLLVLLFTPLFTFASIGLLSALGLDVNPVVLALVLGFWAYFVLLRLLRRGWFRWLRRE